MTLRFCEKCGGLLRKQDIDKEKAYFFCDSCHNFELIKIMDGGDVYSSEKVEMQKERGEGVGEGNNNFADYPNVCKKCGYGFAQILDLGIFYSDEDNLILLKCGKCGFSERIGRKAS